MTIQCKQPVRTCDKCVAQIKSTERPHLPAEPEDDDEEDDDNAEVMSVVSDGKCKATETPFRNTLSSNKVPSLLKNMIEVPESESDREDTDTEDVQDGPPLQLEEVGLHRATSQSVDHSPVASAAPTT